MGWMGRLFKIKRIKPQSLNKLYKGEPARIALRVTSMYVTVGTLWILLSDTFLDMMPISPETRLNISLIKGSLYVIFTGILIYLYIRIELKRVKVIEKELIDTNKYLEKVNEELNSAYKKQEEADGILRQQYNEISENQKKLMKSEERYKIVSEATNEAIWERKHDEITFSDKWYDITGYLKDEICSTLEWEELIHEEDRANYINLLQGGFILNIPWKFEFRMKNKKGKYIWLEAKGKTSLDLDSDDFYSVGSIRDITGIKEYESKLMFLAYHDSLTELYNSKYMKEYYNSWIKENNKKIALLYLDIDNFKFINDTLGHSFGDLLLIDISKRLLKFQRDACRVFRLGGDEFIIVLDNFQELREVEIVALDILKDFDLSYDIQNINLNVKASIGIALYPEHGTTIDEILKNSDIALQKAKELGRNQIVFYNQPMNEAITERVMIEKLLRSALINNEFELYYQPQYNLSENRISGFEALIRWKNSELGMVPPTRFIGIAEATQQIIPIGNWVIKNACFFLKRLNQAGFNNLNISVNVSVVQLLQDDFIDSILDVLDLYSLEASQFEIEITESTLIESYELIAAKLKRLSDIGVSIALDDFGTGYSSLNYLRLLPISTLKVDKSFIDTITLDEKHKGLIELIVKLGKTFRLNIIAEGVETSEQLEYLAANSCDKIQGYYFSRPIPEESILKLLEEKYMPVEN